MKPGLYWHVHHKKLYEYCYDQQGRIDYIKKEKPKEEIATRLRLMRPVKGKLGDAKAWAACAKALAAYDKAGAAYGKAWAAYDKAGAAYGKAWADYGKAWAAYVKAGAAYDKAWAAYGKAWAAYVKAGAAWEATIKPGEAEALHAKECKNCPWDGTTIFPEKGTK